MKSSNNQHIINEMPFWYFNNYMVNFNEFIDKENGTGTTTGTDENALDSPQKQYQNTLASAKSAFKKPNLGSMKLPK